jgi:hypothetical protein
MKKAKSKELSKSIKLLIGISHKRKFYQEIEDVLTHTVKSFMEIHNLQEFSIDKFIITNTGNELKIKIK